MFADYNTFTNNRPITKSMLAWWAFYQKEQKIFDSDKSIILSKKKQKSFSSNSLFLFLYLKK